MTDRELLELAAKAAGIDVPKESPWGGINATDGVWRDISGGGDGTRHSRWNPLTNDGDALRLAVKLDLQVYPTDVIGAACATDGDHASSLVAHLADKGAAVRRAIVQAAAKLGKAP